MLASLEMAPGMARGLAVTAAFGGKINYKQTIAYMLGSIINDQAINLLAIH